MIIFVITILTYLLYQNYETFTIKKSNAYINEVLRHISYTANVLFYNTQAEVIQSYNDSAIRQLMHVPQEDYVEKVRLLQKVEERKNANSSLQSIYIYNSQFNTMYVNGREARLDTFPDQEIIAILKNIENYKKMYPLSRKVPPVLFGQKEEEVFTFIYYQVNKSTGITGAIVLNVFRQTLIDTIREMSPELASEIIVLNEENKVIISNELFPYGHELSQDEPLLSVLAKDERDGMDVIKLNGSKYLVTYVKVDLLNWTYIRLTPYETLTAGLSKVKSTSMLIMSLFLLLGITVSWFIRGFITKQLRNLFIRLKRLEIESNTTLKIRKSKYIQTLLSGEANIPIEAAQEKLIEYESKLQLHQPITMILIGIDCYDKMMVNDDRIQMIRMKEQLIQLCGNLLRSHEGKEIVDIHHNGEIIVLLNKVEQSNEDWEATLKELLTQLNSELKSAFEVTVTSSYITDLLQDTHLHVMNRFCKESLNYRLIYGYEQIIDVVRIRHYLENETSYLYPISDELSYIDKLIREDYEGAKALYDQIIGEAMKHAYTNVRLAVMHLAIATKTAVDRLENKKKYYLELDMNIWMQELQRSDTIQEINLIFYQQLEKLEQQSVKRNVQQDEGEKEEMLSKIDDIIKRRYADETFSPEAVANELSMSPDVLKRTFKKYFVCSLSDYITSYRLERTKQLLTETDSPVSEIAAVVGFSNLNYLYTLFKKKFGMTPSEYRNLQ